MTGPLLNQAEAAQLLGLSPNTLRRWRHEGRGPTWVRLEGAVRYAPEALDEFVAAGRRRSTSDQRAGVH
jgi:predicted site-specific integrase-resolvase